LRTGTDDAPIGAEAMVKSLNLAEGKLLATMDVGRRMVSETSSPAETFGSSANSIIADALAAQASVVEAAPTTVEGVQASAVQASVAETIAARTSAPIKPVISRTPADPFVAPPPAVPSSKSVVEPPASAAPFNAETMANAGGSAAKAQSLFQRVTGMGRKAREEVATATDFLDGVSPPMAQPAAPSQAAVTEAMPLEGHPKLGSLERADRVTLSGADDDLLDIPAFLRRQAN
ncbi:MAG: hypothetical protein OSB69_02575, partial [Alphaproteobacteria bacterium]|nr:hypothetical protein [Alphaproteobacteria bacterium]